MANHHPKAEKELVQEEVLLDDPDFLKEIVRRVLQQLLETEMTEHIGAAPYQRTEDRKGHRNGYKPRTLKTRVGKLELLVPQDREGTFSTHLFARYQRNEKALVLALMEMYVEGVSTRKVKEVTEELCGTSFSKSLVSSLAGRLDIDTDASGEDELIAPERRPDHGGAVEADAGQRAPNLGHHAPQCCLPGGRKVTGPQRLGQLLLGNGTVPGGDQHGEGEATLPATQGPLIEDAGGALEPDGPDH